MSNAGGLGILASATMSLAELRSAIKETAAGTNGPFGVNIRADAPDAGERVAAVIGAGVPVASFALAPKPELIAALKDAGVVTIASVGSAQARGEGGGVGRRCGDRDRRRGRRAHRRGARPAC